MEEERAVRVQIGPEAEVADYLALFDRARDPGNDRESEYAHDHVQRKIPWPVGNIVDKDEQNSSDHTLLGGHAVLVVHDEQHTESELEQPGHGRGIQAHNQEGRLLKRENSGHQEGEDDT
ncbi:hypothetical protein, partial [Oceanidesulfovibrio marinus]|uniref:hypothetical protein n=1 Tax=Oceanidesulfovibrio marinus TaxID=370038 RepID=UPI001ABF16AB